MKALFIALSFFLCTPLQAKQINVYLKLNDQALIKTIMMFNETLEASDIFKHYDIEPFIHHHPLHITLFLAEYQAESLQNLIEKVQFIAKNQPTVPIQTAQLSLTPGNYLMLEINNNPLNSGDNNALQKLSDQIVWSLHDSRDFKAKIPDWASTIPEKKKAFIRYGSPNVFFEFSPHLSLLAKKFIDKDLEASFRYELKKIIESYDFPIITLKAKAIGIGTVDEFGQITEELISLPLKG